MVFFILYFSGASRRAFGGKEDATTVEIAELFGDDGLTTIDSDVGSD